MNTDWQRVKQVLAEAVSRNSPTERAVYLEEACRGDAPLRTQVEKLLKAHEQAGAFLEEPAIPLPEAADIGLVAPLTEKIGDRIGPYKLLEHRTASTRCRQPSACHHCGRSSRNSPARRGGKCLQY